MVAPFPPLSVAPAAPPPLPTRTPLAARRASPPAACTRRAPPRSSRCDTTTRATPLHPRCSNDVILIHGPCLQTLFGGKGEMEGGKGEMEVTNEHFVLKNAIKGPFPAGIKTAVFGTGCGPRPGAQLRSPHVRWHLTSPPLSLHPPCRCFWGTEKGFWRLPVRAQPSPPGVFRRRLLGLWSPPLLHSLSP